MKKFNQEPTVRKRKDRVATEKKLISSVGELMEQYGPAGLTVNNLRNHSGIAKTAIYRYFGGLNGLITAYYNSEDIRIQELEVDVTSLTKEKVIDLIVDSVEKTFHIIAHNKVIWKFMLWELTQRKKVLRNILKQREAVHVAFLKKIEPFLRDCSLDFKAVYAIIYSAINCLVLDAKACPGTHYGYHISNAKERERFFNTIRSILTFTLN